VHNSNADLDRRLVVHIAEQVATGLWYLHSREPPIVHRDIKSHNILLLHEASAVKICDFGLVPSKEPTAGTPNYMAPELFEAKYFDCSVDVFALGVVLNEMFAREVPWDGYQPLDIKDKVVEGERPPVCKTMPTAAQSLLQRLWHQSTKLRPTSEEAASALRDIEDSLPRVGSSGRPMGDTLDDFSSLRLGQTM